MNLLVAFYLLLASAAGPPSPVDVEIADGEWSQLPSLQARGYDHLSIKFMARLLEIASEGQ
jgi:hypothetical protein